MKNPLVERGRLKSHKEMNTNFMLNDKSTGKKRNKSSTLSFYTVGKGSSLNTRSKSSPSTKNNYHQNTHYHKLNNQHLQIQLMHQTQAKIWCYTRSHFLTFVQMICPYIFHFLKNTPPFGRTLFISFRIYGCAIKFSVNCVQVKADSIVGAMWMEYGAVYANN